MDEVGEKFKSGEAYIPNSCLCKAMNAGLEVRNFLVVVTKCPGKVCIGTVRGDIHIGKIWLNYAKAKALKLSIWEQMLSLKLL